MPLLTIEGKATGSRARAGVLHTRHGEVPTPIFMPVGSQASVKALTPDDLRMVGAVMVLSNAYHLYLRPGVDAVRTLGGLHKFMGWSGPVLTDSGGYQVFSLAPLRSLSDEGVRFRSHVDGSEHFFSPEKVMDIQHSLGADIIMPLDQCPSHLAEEAEIKQAMERTHHWAKRSLEAHAGGDQALFGIVQGGISADLRRESASYLGDLDFPGYSIGGLSLGEPKEVTFDILEKTTVHLPEDKPRYLMGVGSPEDILEGVERGVDMFDSALPTRTARNGSLFTHRGRRNILNASYRLQHGPLDSTCACYTCQRFSAAYLHHLFKSKELLAYRLATIHNLYFILDFMKEIRQAVLDDRFTAYRKAFLDSYCTTNEEVRISQKAKWLENRASSSEN